jgi:hypothetical protein
VLQAAGIGAWSPDLQASYWHAWACRAAAGGSAGADGREAGENNEPAGRAQAGAGDACSSVAGGRVWQLRVCAGKTTARGLNRLMDK